MDKYESLIAAIKDTLKGYQINDEADVITTIKLISKEYVELFEAYKQLIDELEELRTKQELLESL